MAAGLVAGAAAPPVVSGLDAQLLVLGYAALAPAGALRVFSGWQLQRSVGFLLVLLVVVLVAPPLRCRGDGICPLALAT